MTSFDLLLFLASIVASAVASVAGFGIGSILTPILALQSDTKLAVAAISIPHFVASVIRFWLIRKHVNKQVLLNFGITSAVGGLVGALLNSNFDSTGLTLIFSVLLIFAGFMGMTGLSQKMRFYGPVAWIAGGLSGGFGGLVGNQGGIRSAALMTFNLSKESLVATATAIGVIVDLARMPVYLWTEHQEMYSSLHWIIVATIGVVAGTAIGIKFLHGVSEVTFRRILGFFIFLLGIYMALKGSRA